MKTLRNCFLMLVPLALAGSTCAEETNEVGSISSRIHISAFADIQSSYWARGENASGELGIALPL